MTPTPEEEKQLDAYSKSVERWMKAHNAPPEIMEQARERVKALRQYMEAFPGKVRFGRVSTRKPPPQ
jgi:hypothetical protein